MKARSQRKWYLYLAATVIVAAVLRLVAIDRDSLWFDEAISYLTATLPLEGIFNNTIQDPHPPVYYGLLHLWMSGLPDSDLAIRLSSLILNLLLIPLIFILSIELFDNKRIGLLAAILVAISPFHILYSHELRMYTLLMCLAILVVISYLRAFQTGHWYWWVFFAFTSLIAIYTHLFAWLMLAGIGTYALIHWNRKRELVISITIGVLLLVLFLPWLLMLAGEDQLEAGSLRPITRDREDTYNPLKLVTAPAFLLFGQSKTMWYAAGILFLVISIGIILIIEIRKAKIDDKDKGLLMPILVVVWSIGIPAVVYLVRPFFLPERTMATAAPFLIVLMAWGFTRRGSPLKYLVIGAATFMLIGSLVYLAGDPVKPPYRSTMDYVESNRQDGDVVLHTSDGSYLPALRYVDFGNHAVLAGDPDPRKPIPVYEALGGELWTRERALGTGNRLWLIVALEHSLDWQQEQASYFAEQYRLVDQQDFGGISVYLYIAPTETVLKQ
jgi:uncharacterized membrane protein